MASVVVFGGVGGLWLEVHLFVASIFVCNARGIML